ncbi:3'-5' exonuclease [Marinobacter salexigens]|uniref:3'-5' exonuclease n=1 Tax=Marinobacter salexigens TaxID=1925763 RepID=UPI000C2853AA|nr:3'-5' exonuclease [Marinobacter salexigens]
MSENDSLPDATKNLPWPEQYQALSKSAQAPVLKAFYEAGCVSEDTPISEVAMVALDFETTGLEADAHSIVSIGLVPFTLDAILLNQAKHWIVRPRLPLHQTSVTFHGITHADISDAPDLSDILEEVFASLNGRIPVVHFRHIERPFLNVALQYRLNEGIRFPLIDTMAIEAHLHPDRQPSFFKRLVGEKPISIRLADSRKRYGLPHYAAHNALVDAIATAELLQAQIQHHFGVQTPIGNLWL